MAASEAILFLWQPNHIQTRPRFLPFSVHRQFMHNNLALRRRRRLSLLAAKSTETAASFPGREAEKATIELEFVDPKAGGDGDYGRQMVTAVSGEKLLRNVMIENKIELYAAYGKVMNCGGGGSCGTCIVEIVDGQDLLNERTDTEKRYLKKKPETWRLACQTIVGNKENSGKVVVQRLPQWKK